MKHQRKSPDRELSQVIERQMRNWEIARSQKAEAEISSDTGVADFVAVSRAVGLPGLRIATMLGDRLDWPVFVRQVLQAMAGEDEYRERLYAAMDGRDVSWLEDIARSMGLGKYGQGDYFRRLTTTVLSIARTGHAVFLGRAADLILPKTAGFRVGLTASKEYCLESYAEQKGVPLDQARREVRDIEEERTAFIRRHFRVKADDPCRCDLLINMERFTENQIADLVMSALRIRGIRR
jgi:hypothetical protein